MKKLSGFTLIELMIVVLVVAILGALATSYYGDSVIKSKRTDGRSTLLDTASRLEKCKAVYGAYNNANCSVSNGDSIDSKEGLYSINVTSTATTFNLTANPVAGQSQANDTKCTSITLDNLGQQSGTGAEPASCW
jgi:type IV pilus assembly protein PilE